MLDWIRGLMDGISDFFTDGETVNALRLSVASGIILAMILGFIRGVRNKVAGFFRWVLSWIRKPRVTPIIPEKNPYFTGREETLTLLRKKLRSTGKVTLYGNRGFGKTQIATQYAHNKRWLYKHIWFVNAENTTTLDESYRNIARRIGVKEWNPDKILFDELCNKMKILLEASKNTLLVYDNAEGLGSALKDYLPAISGKNNIIFCTWDKNVAFAEELDVDVFTENEARLFLKKAVKHGITDIDAKGIYERLERLPLALSHAAGYINEMKYTPTEYIEVFERQGLSLMGSKLLKDQYHTIVTKTWLISMAKLSQEAKEFISMCAYCAPKNIPLDLFIAGREELPLSLKDKLAPGNNKAHDSILGELARFCLASFERVDGRVYVSMHGLVQEAIRDGFGEDGTWCGHCLGVMYAGFRFDENDVSSIIDFDTHSAHILAVAGYAHRKFTEDTEYLKKISLLYNAVGRGFNNTGQHADAVKRFETAIEIEILIRGTETHQNIARGYNNMAVAYKDVGQTDKSLELLEKSLTIICETDGDDSDYAATIYNNMADAYEELGNYTEALALFDKALNIGMVRHGEQSHVVAKRYNNMAATYVRQGMYNRALELYNKTLKIREELYSKNHIIMANTYNNIATVYGEQGEYQSALDMYLIAYRIVHVLGDEHPQVQLIYNNMEDCYQSAAKAHPRQYRKPFKKWLASRLRDK